MFPKKFVDGPIKVAPSNKHKEEEKGCNAQLINKKHENTPIYP